MCARSWLSHPAVFLEMARPLTITSAPQGATICFAIYPSPTVVYIHSCFCLVCVSIKIKNNIRETIINYMLDIKPNEMETVLCLVCTLQILSVAILLSLITLHIAASQNGFNA